MKNNYKKYYLLSLENYKNDKNLTMHELAEISSYSHAWLYRLMPKNEKCKITTVLRSRLIEKIPGIEDYIEEERQV